MQEQNIPNYNESEGTDRMSHEHSMYMKELSVVVCTYDDPIELFEKCINSLLVQQTIKELIIIDSSKNDVIKDFCIKKGGKIRYHYSPPKGLSEAKNEGVIRSSNTIIAFTDSDCIVDEKWAENLYSSFSNNIAVVGGKILPKWLSKPNGIFLKSTIAQGFYSLFDMGDKLKDVDFIFGGGFAINRTLIKGQLFLSNLRTKENLICGEETNLCKRVKENRLRIIYNPSVIIWHQVPRERLKFQWMWKRVYSSGLTRAILGGKPTPKHIAGLNYNIYDMIFLIYFIIPYATGFIYGKLIHKKKFDKFIDD